MLLLSQAIRRVGRPSLPIPSPAVSAVAQVFRRAGLVDFSPEQMRYLEHGRVADVTRAEKEFDWVPRSTAEAMDSFVAARAARCSTPRRSRRPSSSCSAADPCPPVAEGAGPCLRPRSSRCTARRRAGRRARQPGRRSRADRAGRRASRRARGPRAVAAPAEPSAWEQKLAGGLAFLRRRLTGDYEIDDFGFDADLTENVLLPPLRPLYDKWFRVETRGLDNVPDVGGALIVANHSGTIPLDALMTTLALHDHHPAHRHLRLLGADLVFTLPVVAPLARKGGNTLACNADAERLLSDDELVGVFPEGFKGIGKPFSERYKLQRFGRGGFVSAALRTGKPIIPVSIVGAEEIYPIIGNSKTLSRLLGLPYVPITPLFPLLGPARRRSRCPASGSSSSASRSRPPTSAARPRPTTRCWSSTSPTRCARRSSRRSTACSCSAAPSSSSPPRLRDPSALRAIRGLTHSGRDAAVDGVGGTARASVAAGEGAQAAGEGAALRPTPAVGQRRPSPRRPAAPVPAVAGTPTLAALRPVRKSRTSQPFCRAIAAQPGVGVDRHGVADRGQHRDVVDRVGVGRAAGQVQALALGQRLDRLGLRRARAAARPTSRPV